MSKNSKQPIEQQRDQLLAALKKSVIIIDGAIYCGHELNENGQAMLLDVRAAIAAVEQSFSSPAVGADGWTGWKGGECPVPDPVAVDVRFRTGVEDHGREAGAWFWINDGTDTDIVAYRVVQGGA